MPTAAALSHIPGPRPLPLLGSTLEIVSDALGFCARTESRYGPIYKVHNLGKWRVNLSGADALEYVVNDPDRIFSAHDGWEMLERLYSGGILLRDFDDHRRHRRILQTAFRAPVIESYVAAMAESFATEVAAWPRDSVFAFHPAVKTLALRMSSTVFLGLRPDAPEAARFEDLLGTETAAIVGLVRRPLPFTKMGRGTAARRKMAKLLKSLIPQRRANPGGDFFSQMCVAVDDDGRSWSDAEIVDHFNFLLAAAHDTSATLLAKIVWALGAFPEWQEKAAGEIAAAGPGPLDTKALAKLDICDRIVKEALRLMPPVPFILRRALKGFEFGGYKIPAGTWVYANPALTMRDPAHFTDPDAFDPDRFLPERAEGRGHRFAYAPFGGGAHKCIGMHFAQNSAKMLMVALLRHTRVELAAPSDAPWQVVPIPEPRNGLPVRLIDRPDLDAAAA